MFVAKMRPTHSANGLAKIVRTSSWLTQTSSPRKNHNHFPGHQHGFATVAPHRDGNRSTIAASSIDLSRSSDRLSAPVKVEAPAPVAVLTEGFTIGLSQATKSTLSKVVAKNDGTLPSETFKRLADIGLLSHSDPNQLAALVPLDSLFTRLSKQSPPEASNTGGGFLSTLIKEGISLPSLEHDFGAQRWRLTWTPRNQPPPSIATSSEAKTLHQQGLYLHGGVGCGKTMLMDLFYYTLPQKKKRRIHFHSFMGDVHLRVHNRRRTHGGEVDPLPAIAAEILSEAWVLCFDEFQVTDVADAMIMARLFAEYFKIGGVIVATSNRIPDSLYEHGLQRSLFLPFIKTLKQRVVVHDMASTTDYRLTGEHKDNVFMTPCDATATMRLNNLFSLLTKGEPIEAATFRSRGRDVYVPEAAQNTKVARFSFADLCTKPLGVAHYQVIARHFHTIFITDIPLLDTGVRINETRRFITLIDTLYENHVKIVCTSQGTPEELLDKTVETAKQEVDILGTSAAVQDNQDEKFAFERTVSRLNEMQTEQYLLQSHLGDADAGDDVGVGDDADGSGDGGVNK
eukprot:m.174177 g.174177  ORF g.174177 m.174177 type:complete len:569 (-) comp31756_c0_seq2:292-1998(-)